VCDARVVLVVSALVALGYTYLGYPALIALCARVASAKRQALDKAARPRTDPEPARAAPFISVFLPVFDGAAALPRKIDSLLTQDHPASRIEILVYCDGCGDHSEAAARAAAARPEAGGRIRVFAAPVRRGKPAAINRLAAEARGDLFLFNDVRQPLSANAARALAVAFSDSRVGCATGRLVLDGSAASGAYWRYEDWIRTQESRFRGVVGMTGAISMMRRTDFVPLPEALILDDVWIPMRLALAGKRVVSVSDATAHDAAFDDQREFRRKVRTLAGNYQLFALLPALLVPFRNPIWLETFSHKVLRLCAPWLLLALLVASSSAAGSAAWSSRAAGGTPMRVVLAAQLAFYLAAALGFRAGRVAGLARSFVVLNVAAVAGLWRYLSRRQRVTW
jgi:cellulose synthase/poly-beta-1,6-N-acetylglucosamine synthase-like glycosyltransferase